MGYENWPWPSQGSLRWNTKWWPTAHPHARIASRIRRTELIGDAVVLSAIGFLVFKVWYNSESGAYKSKGSALIGQPPALVAQTYNFSDVSSNRTVSREALQSYKDELATARKSGSSGADIAFKY
ncbi:hypothetical protein DIPPA_02316 [Diplonema papillatum]|nr:hypothetical protein DIPPA_02316 [Diplonema papillatum]